MAEMSPLFRGKAGRAFAGGLKHLLKIDKVEWFYEKICGWDGEKETGATGIEFAKGSIEESGFRMTLNGMPRDEAIDWLRENLPSGGFITISNHTLGALDGLGLIDLFGHATGNLPDGESRYKYMVNSLLLRMNAAASCFISVTPTGTVRTAPTAESIAGIYAAKAHLDAGGALGLFPAGAVSNLETGRRPIVRLPDAGWDLPSCYTEPRVRDREWQMSIIKFIKRAGVPVLPVLNATQNSKFFYNLGLIDWRLRLTRLPAEMLNKRGQELRFVAGPMIPAEKIASVQSLKELRTLLRASVYSLL